MRSNTPEVNTGADPATSGQERDIITILQVCCLERWGERDWEGWGWVGKLPAASPSRRCAALREGVVQGLGGGVAGGRWHHTTLHACQRFSARVCVWSSLEQSILH